MSILDEVIQQASIKEMLAYYGVEKRGDKYICPFHNDKNPSLSVTDDDRRFTCFTCGEGGNIDNLVQKMEAKRGNYELGDSTADAYRKRMDFIIKTQHLNVEFSLTPQSKPKALTPEEQKRNRALGILNEAQKISAKELADDQQKRSKASRYLASRGISDGTINAFGVGYNNNSLITDKLKEQYTDDELFNVGLLALNKANNRYYDAQYDRVLIPIKDSKGVIVGFGGRSLEENPSVKYKNTRKTDYFKKREILFNYNLAHREARIKNEIILVEGYFDVISAYEMGMKNTVGLMGVELTDEHKELLKNITDNKLTVTLCLDNDDAGRKSMCKIIPVLVAEGYDVKVIDTQKLNKGKDMNDFLCADVSVDELNKYKISAVAFLIKYSFNYYYQKDGDINIETVKKVYDSIFQYSQFSNSYNEVLFEEFVSKNYGFNKENVQKICHPIEHSPLLNSAMQVYFCNLIKGQLSLYAQKTDNRILQQFLEQKRIMTKHIIEGMNSPKFIENNGCKLNIVAYCNDYLMKTQEYKEFEQLFDKDFNRLLDNVFGVDKGGNMIRIYLNAKQKDIIQKQFNNSMPDDVKENVRLEPERFIKLYVADSIQEFEQMLGNDYRLKETALAKFNKGEMSFINYGARFFVNQLDELHHNEPNKYTTEDGSNFQAVFVFNNSGNKLDLQPSNYVLPVQMNEYKADDIEDRSMVSPITSNMERGRMSYNEFTHSSSVRKNRE